MKNTKSFVKQAEQNAINNAKYCQDILKIIDALGSFSYRFMAERDAQIAVSHLNQYRNFVYNEMNERLARCFMFVGVGGEESEQFSREQFKEHFGDDRYCVAHFLDECGRLPSSWSGLDEKEFRKEAKEKISNE